MDTRDKIGTQFFLYACVGVWNTVFGYLIIFGCMYLLKISPILSNVVGYFVAVALSFVLNRIFVFKSKNDTAGELAKFIVVFFVAFGINLGTLHVLIAYIHVHSGISQILAGIVYTAVSFVMNKTLVFSR